jgi:DNA repair protein RecO (recombination protein O)
MNSIKTYTTAGIILKYIPYKEADLIVTLLTENTGKVKAVAQGARRIKSKFIGHLEPLTIINGLLIKGKTLDTISQVDIKQSYPEFYMDLNRLSRGLYICELVDQFAPENEPNKPLFRLTMRILSILTNSTEIDYELALREFEFQILKISGLMPELYNCVSCNTSIIPNDHNYSAVGGGVICTDCSSNIQTSPMSLSAIKLIRFFDNKSILEDSQISISPETIQEVKSLLINSIIHWLERELKSNNFINHLKSLNNNKTDLETDRMTMKG